MARKPMSPPAAGSVTINLAAIPPGRKPPRPGTIAVDKGNDPAPSPDACCTFHATAYFAGFGECPVCLLPRVASGEAVLEDPHAAAEAVALLRDRARLLEPMDPAVDLNLSATNPHADESRPEPVPAGLRPSTYQALVDAAFARMRQERAERAAAAAGVTPGDSPQPWAPPALLTADEVASILRVSTRTVDRIAGTSIPAPLRVGGQRRWRADALAAFLSGGAA